MKAVIWHDLTNQDYPVYYLRLYGDILYSEIHISPSDADELKRMFLINIVEVYDKIDMIKIPKFATE